jgi:cell wall assembly regulator SMI1
MRADTIHRLDALFERWPVLVGTSVAPEEVTVAEADVGIPFPDDYREFICRYGGALVGRCPIFGLRPTDALGERYVTNVTRRYRDQKWPYVEYWAVFSEDDAGNPIGMTALGRVMCFDHDVRKLSEIAPSFEEFLVDVLDEM